MPKSTASLSIALSIPFAFAACAEPVAPELDDATIVAAGRQGRRELPHTIEDYLAMPGPVAIAHRGFGGNLGEDPTRPIENTVAAVRRGYRAGATIVEVDLQLTADGVVVVFHDDFLQPDFACINRLTFDELRARVPHVPTLRRVLRTVERFNDDDRPASGLVVLELKTPPPLCDPGDTTEAALVDAALAVVRLAGLEDQVMFDSFSPALLDLVTERAPAIATELSVTALQMLTPEQAAGATGLEVRLVDKVRHLGLTWAEVGVIARLPGYPSIATALGTAHAIGARQVALDLLILGQAEQLQPGAGAAIVAGAHSLGLEVSVYTVTDAAQWALAAALGADSIYADNVIEVLALTGADDRDEDSDSDSD